MSRMNGTARQKAWSRLAQRDGIRCTKAGCNRPWWGKWNKEQIVDYARKKSINLPVGPEVPDDQFFQALAEPKGDIELIARKRLVVHHKDNNQHNNPKDGSNHTLVHLSCNILIDPRGTQKNPKFNGIQRLKTLQEKARERNKETPRVQTMQMLKNLLGETPFRLFVQEKIARFGEWEKEDLCVSGAEHCTQLGTSISESTAEKWLKKMTSSTGEYEGFFKEDPESGEKVTYIQRKRS